MAEDTLPPRPPIFSAGGRFDFDDPEFQSAAETYIKWRELQQKPWVREGVLPDAYHISHDMTPSERAAHIASRPDARVPGWALLRPTSQGGGQFARRDGALVMKVATSNGTRVWQVWRYDNKSQSAVTFIDLPREGGSAVALRRADAIYELAVYRGIAGELVAEDSGRFAKVPNCRFDLEQIDAYVAHGGPLPKPAPVALDRPEDHDALVTNPDGSRAESIGDLLRNAREKREKDQRRA